MQRFLFALFLFAAMPVWAAENPLGNSKEPITIEASHELEWLRNENKYRATQDVVITQGATIIRGDSAEASYDPSKGSSALTVMTVTGHVNITQEGRTITSEMAVYDAVTQKLVLSGGAVKIEAPEFSVESNGPVEYFVAERKAIASGGTTIKQKDQTLKAQSVTAWFGEGNKLTKAVADKNVIITRDTSEGKDVAQAQHADYNATTGKALLTGDVRLARGTNFMQGARASIDLKTGYSSLQNDASSGGRVRAIFTPGGASPLPQQAITVPVVQGKENPERAYQ